MFKSNSRQELDSCALYQFSIADRMPTNGVIMVGMPVCPSPLSSFVVHQLEDMVRYKYTVLANCSAGLAVDRAGDYVHVTFRTTDEFSGVLLNL